MCTEFSDDLIAEIKDEVDIVDFIGDYVDLKKKGKDYFGNCPFHNERTGSFSVTRSKKTYYCFGCGCGGDIINFCKEFLNMSYEEAIVYLSGVAGISPEKTAISETVKIYKKANRKKKERKQKKVPCKHKILDPNILNTYKKREINMWVDEGIKQEIMDFYEIRYDERGKRIVYPVYDTDGNLINIKGRTIFSNYKDFNPPIPKYMNYYPVGDLDYLQCYNKKKHYIEKCGEMIIFESIKSVMKLDEWEYYNSVSSETSKLTIFQARLILRSRCDVVLGYDNDVTLEKILKNEVIRNLARFTNVYVIIDKDGLLGDPKDKNSPADKGKEVWEQLYKQKIKI